MGLEFTSGVPDVLNKRTVRLLSVSFLHLWGWSYHIATHVFLIHSFMNASISITKKTSTSQVFLRTSASVQCFMISRTCFLWAVIPFPCCSALGAAST
ncbi:hypothetical protein PISMIDRAFT_673137 [Pisolithus microcarpus 441]|uniref:Uncharacterized protein n=1 Tax=Pisolithus microcarpus 441 TaxID=765257 RepID=A0A0C9YV19_9AGAM|nr:hypothetical protein BKA83DRAFT_673137 [Pisolithus microcarpus]KIK28885.1 hypothetical protein PISMIDRAFT_673137 [Pisolithus microcarpus 441]